MSQSGPRLLFAACLVCLYLPPAPAEDLGVIHVESSTIADRFDNKRSEPSSIAVIRGRQVDASHAENLQLLLQSIPGITTEVQSGDSIKIHIRGVENQTFMGENPGVAVVIDGVPVFERTGRVNIDLDNIESVKVIKGGASFLFGNDALAGAVIITTKKGARHKGVKADAELGSFGYKKGVAQLGRATDNYNAHVQISRREADGYYQDSGYRADYLNGKLQYYIDDHSDLTFGFEAARRKKDSHGTVDGVTAARDDPTSTNPAYNDYARKFDVKLGKYFLSYSRDIGQSNLLANVYQFTDHTTFISAPTDADPNIYQYHNDYDQVQRGMKMEWRRGGKSLAWLGGLDLRANRYNNGSTALVPIAWKHVNAGDVVSDNRTDEDVRAVYGEVKYRPVTPLTFTANARFDHIALDYSDYATPSDSNSRTFRVPSYRLGFNYALTANADLYGNASTGFRAPSVQELFTGRYSPLGDTAGNPDLKAERALNMELGLRLKLRLFGVAHDADLSLFQINRRDYIDASNGLYVGQGQFENIGGVRNRGLELSLRSDPARRVVWDLAYTYIDARYTQYPNYQLMTANPAYNPACHGPSCPPEYLTTTYDNTGNRVPRVPRHHLNIKVYVKPADGWMVTTEADYSTDYYADELNRLKVGGHTVVNLLASYARKTHGANWAVFGRVDNLFDEFYYNTARAFYDSNGDSRYNAEDMSIVVNQGRTYTAGVSARF
ncbi:MAG: TonB-dependent receptor [Gammaproteobacteria bacterium]